MRIGIEATGMLVPQQTGIQRYVTSLILALAATLDEVPGFELFLYFNIGDRHVDPALMERYGPQIGGARSRLWPAPRGFRIALPLLAAMDRLDLLHLPVPRMPRFSLCPTLVTIHDLSWRKLPRQVVEGERLTGMRAAERSIRKASAFVAVSQNTREDLISEYSIRPDRVTVTYEGVSDRYRSWPKDPSEPQRKYMLGSYILYVGTLQRRKNVIRLLEAYAKLLSEELIGHGLVLAGAEGWGSDEIVAAVQRLDLGDKVRLPGYVPEKDLPALYAGADLFVYPSLYEGFGLPVLEAMASGTPVAVSRTSSLPEIVGDAGIYFDPLSVEDITRAMLTILTDQELALELGRSGRERANEFDWLITARKTREVYISLANGGRSIPKTAPERLA